MLLLTTLRTAASSSSPGNGLQSQGSTRVSVCEGSHARPSQEKKRKKRRKKTAALAFPPSPATHLGLRM